MKVYVITKTPTSLRFNSYDVLRINDNRITLNSSGSFVERLRNINNIDGIVCMFFDKRLIERYFEKIKRDFLEMLYLEKQDLLKKIYRLENLTIEGASK